MKFADISRALAAILIVATFALASWCCTRRQGTEVLTQAQRVVRLSKPGARPALFRVELRRTAAAETLFMTINGPPAEGPVRSREGASGLDVDSIIASTKKCSDLACVRDLIARREGAPPASFVLQPGAIEASTDATIRLAGTRPGGKHVEPDRFTPSTIDSDLEVGSGFLSLGTSGQLLVGFPGIGPPLKYVYIALADSADDLEPSSIMFWVAPPPDAASRGHMEDPRIKAAREVAKACASQTALRLSLESAREAAVTCLQSRQPALAAKVKATSVEDVRFSCYASNYDSLCAYGSSNTLYVNEQKYAANATPCGASRGSVLLLALLDASPGFLSFDIDRLAPECLVGGNEVEPDHAVAELEELAGLVGATKVYRARVPLDLARWYVIEDSGAHTGGSGPLSGFDLDAAKVSTIRCEDASCAAGLPTSRAQYVFAPGTMRGTVSGRLNGTDATGEKIEPTAATLDRFDGDVSGTGFLSLGVRGALATDFLNPVSRDNYVYFGDVGSNDKARPTVTFWKVFPRAPPSLADKQHNTVGAEALGAQVIKAVADARRRWHAERSLHNADLDGDGCPNYIASGWDSNCDGAPDAQRAGGDNRFVYDLDADGDVDFAREVFQDARGWRGYRDSFDRDGDRRVDRVVSALASPDHHVIDVLAEDKDPQSGALSVLWKARYEGKLHQQVETPRENAWTNMSYQGCDAALTKQLMAAWNSMTWRGSSCVGELSPVLSQALLNLVAKARTVTISCFPWEGRPTAQVSADSLATCNAWVDAESCDVNIEVKANMSEAERAHLDMVLFHELAHYWLKPGPNHNDSNTEQYDRFDEVYACSNFCFPESKGSAFSAPRNLNDCYQCAASLFDQASGEARCKRAAQALKEGKPRQKGQPPKQNVTCWACDPAKGMYIYSRYDSLGECSAKCPVERTIKCFADPRYCEVGTDLRDLRSE